MDVDVGAQRELKKRMLSERFGIEIDRVVSTDGNGLGYRWSSRRVVGGTAGAATLGSFRRGSHDVAPMDECLVDHPDIVACAAEVQRAVNEIGIEPFAEEKETGDLHYVWFKTDGRGSVLVTLITAEPFSRAADELPARLSLPTGIAWGLRTGSNNGVRGTTVRPLKGRQSLLLDLDGIQVHTGPLGFLQPNPRIVAAMCRDLIGMPAGGAVRGHRAIDLYAGVGITTRLLRNNFHRVAAFEPYPRSARMLQIEPELAEEALARILSSDNPTEREIDLIIANPPRGGIGPTVCDQLNRLRPARLHISSANPTSIVEDLNRLAGEDGAFRVLQARGYDTRPQTPDVEVISWLVAR
jgi:23S rRNA (uracil1939-C5)-methyltransferase